jgi:hypothetical protein
MIAAVAIVLLRCFERRMGYREVNRDKLSRLCHLSNSSRVTSEFIGGESARAAIDARAGSVGCAINEVLMRDETWPLLFGGPFRHGDR